MINHGAIYGSVSKNTDKSTLMIYNMNVNKKSSVLEVRNSTTATKQLLLNTIEIRLLKPPETCTSVRRYFFYLRKDLIISAIARKMPGSSLIKATLTTNANVQKGCPSIQRYPFISIFSMINVHRITSSRTEQQPPFTVTFIIP